MASPEDDIDTSWSGWVTSVPREPTTLSRRSCDQCNRYVRLRLFVLISQCVLCDTNTAAGRRANVRIILLVLSPWTDVTLISQLGDRKHPCCTRCLKGKSTCVYPAHRRRPSTGARYRTLINQLRQSDAGIELGLLCPTRVRPLKLMMNVS